MLKGFFNAILTKYSDIYVQYSYPVTGPPNIFLVTLDTYFFEDAR